MDLRNEADGRIDGRTARRDRNKVAVLDATIELFNENNLTPGVHEVAERSGVSLRSVYRYFEDVDDLIAAAITRQFDRNRDLFQIDDVGDRTVAERIDRFTRSRVELFEAVRVVFRAATIRAGSDEQIRDGLAHVRRRLAEQSQELFRGELDAMDEASSLHAELTMDVLGQFETLERLRSERDLDTDQTVAYLKLCLQTVLGVG